MSITVRVGPMVKVFDQLANKTVMQIRRDLAGHMAIPEASRATVNNVDVSEDQVVQDFQTIEFVVQSGSKGTDSVA